MTNKDDTFEEFIDNLEEPKRPEKKGLFAKLFGVRASKSSARQKQSNDSSKDFYDESMDFLETTDDSGNLYDTTSQTDTSKEEFVPTLKNLFGFKVWEFGVIVIEFLLILYMILVLLKLVPLF